MQQRTRLIRGINRLKGNELLEPLKAIVGGQQRNPGAFLQRSVRGDERWIASNYQLLFCRHARLLTNFQSNLAKYGYNRVAHFTLSFSVSIC